LKCDNEPFSMHCSGDRVIQVKKAAYGRQAYDPCPVGDRSDISCSATNATLAVQLRCEGYSSCAFDVHSDVFGGEPCAGISKYLDVDFECVTPPPSEIICQGQDLTITCGAGEEIHVQSAAYGRTSMLPCADENRHSTSCEASNALGVVVAACEGHPSCTIDATNDRFGDPCNSTSKYLTVTHECRTIARPTASACLGQGVSTLTCSPGHFINVETAVFGLESCSSNTLTAVQAECEGMQLCQIEAAVPQYGIECPAFSGERCVDVVYKCLTKQPTGLACEGNSLNITCPPNTQLTINDAFYGRTEYDWCAHPNRANLQCSASGVLDKVRQLCPSAPCDLSAADANFGDPCPDTFKYLSLDWTCQ